jgi:hypothetical protein
MMVAVIVFICHAPFRLADLGVTLKTVQVVGL